MRARALAAAPVALAAALVARAAADESSPLSIRIDGSDGGSVNYALYAGAKGCEPAFVAAQFLKTLARGYGAEGVARLTETLRGRRAEPLFPVARFRKRPSYFSKSCLMPGGWSLF